MGNAVYTAMGYGLLVIGTGDDDTGEGFNTPEGVSEELVDIGDSMWDEELGIFFYVPSANVTVDLREVEYVIGDTMEYPKYTLEDLPPEIDAWFKQFQEESMEECKLGVFRTMYFG